VKVIAFLILTAALLASCSSLKTSQNETSAYTIKALKKPFKIDGKWNKSQWRHANTFHITNYMGNKPSYSPTVQGKMLYDKDNLYVIFQVQDNYVRSVVEQYNGPVSTDACVEFFFCPDTSMPDHYFNLEINAGGTPLMAYHIFSHKDYQKLRAEELNKIEIAHSLPKRVDPEITQTVTWTIEYRLPIAILKNYASVTNPKPGNVWKANFYKTASKSSHPHWITWSLVKSEKPNFHLPGFFGKLLFQ
jgi:hypothetical protein